MPNFFKFPHTPHLKWLGNRQPREDKVLSKGAADQLLNNTVIVEEKVDGANLGISVTTEGNLQAQNRGQYLIKPYSGQFSRLESWLSNRESALNQNLGRHLILFGEWCAARHSLNYSELPDWFIVFDVYSRKEERFWTTKRRDRLAEKLSLPTVPELFKGQTDINNLQDMLKNKRSRYSSGPMEGIVIRKEAEDWLGERAKLVRADFTQSIDTHWASRPIEWNRIGK